MDITMPEENGIKDGNAKIIMVTSHGEQDKVIKAIKNGASNYILNIFMYFHI